MHLLDTDTLAHLYRGHPKVVKHLEDLSSTEVRTTVVSRIEILRGRFEFLLKASTSADLLRAQQQLTLTDDFLAQLIIMPFDGSAAAHFSRLRVIPSLRKIGRADMLIASIALAQRATLVTRNTRHFQQFPGLRVENWVD
jgi:tRNA(fMet)-specific endonuclease VapC